MKYSFAADRTLGKLSKWLRILGFDTLFESDISNKGFYDNLAQERILLTRTAKIREQFAAQRLVFIKADHIAEQLRQVIDDLAITRRDIRLFSMCLQCNSPIVAVGKEAVTGRVPDYIWHTHDEFSKCSQCERIFWAGSHVQRSREMIERLFEMKIDD